MSKEIKMNPVGWFEIYVDNIERARDFYESVMDIKLEKLNAPADDIQMLTFPGAGFDKFGANGALVKDKRISAGKNSVLIYFTCEDCSLQESRVVTAGGKVEQSKFSIGENGFISLITDTEGNAIGLHSMS